MSDYGDLCRDMRAYKKAMRHHFGINCPVCTKERPKGNPTRMLPKQKCKVCGYVDKRQPITKREFSEKTEWEFDEGRP